MRKSFVSFAILVVSTLSWAGGGAVFHVASGSPPTLVTEIPVGRLPLGIAITPDGTRAYSVDDQSGTLSVIGTDPTDSNTFDHILGTLPSGPQSEGIAIRDDGKLFVTDECIGLLVTDPDSGGIIQQIPVGVISEKVLLVGSIENGNLEAWVANEGGNTGGSVAWVDAQPGSPTEYRLIGSLDVGFAPEALASKMTTTNGLVVYVTLEGSNSILAFSAETHSVLTSIEVGPLPEGIAASPNSPYVYVANSYSNTVTIIDPELNVPLQDLTVGAYPEGIAFSPDGLLAYVANSGDGTMSVIDTTGLAVQYTVNLSDAPYGVAVTPDGANIYVTNSSPPTGISCY